MFVNEVYYDKKMEFKFLEYEQDIKTDFEALDEKLFLEKPKYLYSIGKFQRTVITPYGVVCFKRRKYRYLVQGKWKYLFLLDNEIGLKNYQRITTEFKLKILSYVSDGKRQKDILDVFNNARISRMSISNILKEFNSKSYSRVAKKEISEKIKIDLTSKFLYIQLDETFLRLRKKSKSGKYRIRLATFHTGYKNKGNRPQLENKRAFYIKTSCLTRINTQKYLALVLKEIDFFYKNVDFEKIIVCGDGASWIRNFAEMHNFRYILDKFHIIRNLKSCWFMNQKYLKWSEFIKILNSYSLGNVNKILNILASWKEDTKDNSGKEKVKEVIKYVKNNAKGIHNSSLEWNIGCFIESDISHMVKASLGYGTKIYSSKNFDTIMDLRIAEVNNLDVLRYYKYHLIDVNEVKSNEFKRMKYVRLVDKTNVEYKLKQGKRQITGKIPVKQWLYN